MDRLAARPASRPRPPSHPNTESLTRDSADTGTGHAGAFAAESPVTAQVAKTHPDLASAVRSFIRCFRSGAGYGLSRPTGRPVMPGRSRDSLRPNGQNKPVSDLRLGSRRGRPGPRIPSDVILTSLDVELRGRQLAAGAVGPALWPASAASSAVVSWRRRSASAATGWLQLSSKYSRAPRHQQASPMFAYLLEVRQRTGSFSLASCPSLLERSA